ncbi:hypothetical protein [Streptomyces sp. NPDC007074]|uniref:hypothetical protein n=1 Tax=Streptomyces sp. NPDC007074 TaxID=3156764 RepID=UPI00340B073C
MDALVKDQDNESTYTEGAGAGGAAGGVHGDGRADIGRVDDDTGLLERLTQQGRDDVLVRP